MTTIIPTNKWQNQQIRKKFGNRSCGSRSKKALYRTMKHVPDTMTRGWIRRKALKNGKSGQQINRYRSSSSDLQSARFCSLQQCDLYAYVAEVYEEPEAIWFDEIADPWLQKKNGYVRKSTSRSWRKSRFRRKSTQGHIAPSFASSAPTVMSFDELVNDEVSDLELDDGSHCRRGDSQGATLTDIEYKLTDEEKTEYSALSESYVSLMSDIDENGTYASIENLAQRSSFASHVDDKGDTTGDGSKRIMKEIRKQLPRNLYLSANGAMFVRFDENNPRFLQALLTGLESTPYAHGLFFFDIFLGMEYPQKPLAIKHISYGATSCHANNGPGGFSPNLHQGSGTVCLSLLGTWAGPGWTANESNVYQVLSTIMLMVFGAEHPYYMEPSHGGWEGTVVGRKQHERRVIEYDEEVMYHNAKYTMLETLKTPYVGFEDVIKTHFAIKQKWIVKTIKQWIDNPNYSQSFKLKLQPVFDELKTEFTKLQSSA